MNVHRAMGAWEDGCVVNGHHVMHSCNITMHLHNPQTIHQLLAVAGNGCCAVHHKPTRVQLPQQLHAVLALHGSSMIGRLSTWMSARVPERSDTVGATVATERAVSSKRRRKEKVSTRTLKQREWK